MSEELVYGEDQPSLADTSSLSRPLHLRIARHTSNILSPFVVSFPALILVALYHARDTVLALLYALLALFFMCVGPMIYIIIGVRTGKFTDTDISVRSQRTAPFLFGIVSTCAGLLILTLLHGPRHLTTVLLITILSGLLMLLITQWWKISIHSSSLAGSVTILSILYGWVAWPAFLLVALVSWSRVALRRHTVGQVVIGACISVLLVLVVFRLRGV